MAYFTIMAELRGCYSDNDSAHVIRANTRRELKAALSSEAADLIDAGAVGLNKRAIAALAAMAWAKRKGSNPYPFVCPFKYPHQSGYAMGLFAYVSNRREYLDSQNDY